MTPYILVHLLFDPRICGRAYVHLASHARPETQFAMHGFLLEWRVLEQVRAHVAACSNQCRSILQ